MMRHRSGPPPPDDGSSSEEDAFSALSRKRKGSSSGTGVPTKKASSDSKVPTENLQTSTQESSFLKTSSAKRHHGELSDARKAKMDALILELEVETSRAASQPRSRDQHRADPERSRGSFVDPGDELLTTNIFVGNLAPSITEEQMTDLFRQFGDLYSVKVMWSRTPEERARNRHTGFVCFMNRQDAEDAMDACSDADPFRVGRQLMMRWGKNVRKVAGGAPIVKRGTGGIAPSHRTQTDGENRQAAAVVEATLGATHGKTIRVIPPVDERRFHFISTVASFVAKDGTQFEEMLFEKEFGNPDFHFLSFTPDMTEQQKQECFFYRWRVYSLCQGDSFHSWRTEPFVMLVDGRTWIPPPRDEDAVRKEAEEASRKQEELHSQKEKRKLQSNKRGLLTGRQLEHARRRGGDAGTTLSEPELAEFDKLFKERLCVSRASICEAMSFCFEKSGAARQVSAMLKTLMTEITPGTSVEILTARVFLLSDVLYNSQQPGIRNAFLYRNAIEQMSPEVFKGLGEYTRTSFGRMTSSKLEVAINAVLAAWVNWGVFDPIFLDELQALFEGREYVSKKLADTTEVVAASEPESIEDNLVEESISNKPKGDWTTVSSDGHDAYPNPTKRMETVAAPVSMERDDDADGEPLGDAHAVGDGRVFDADDHDGESLDGDPDGEPLDDDPDGVPMDNDHDGESLDVDPDGIPLDDAPDNEPRDNGPNGGPLDDDPDGEPLGDDPDGEPFGGNLPNEP